MMELSVTHRKREIWSGYGEACQEDKTSIHIKLSLLTLVCTHRTWGGNEHSQLLSLRKLVYVRDTRYASMVPRVWVAVTTLHKLSLSYLHVPASQQVGNLNPRSRSDMVFLTDTKDVEQPMNNISFLKIILVSRVKMWIEKLLT